MNHLITETAIVEISLLHPHPQNVRQGDIGAISQSLAVNGQYRPIIYQKSTGRILAGNHTWKAALASGWTKILATSIVCDDDRALRILICDNRTNDLASYDDSALADLLKELAATELGLTGTMFDGDDLDTLLQDGAGDTFDETPEDDAAAVSISGDVWLLGDHRVMCGRLDTRYVDVICARYQKHTGTRPILESTGEAHDFTTQ